MHEINAGLAEADLNFDESIQLNGKVVDINERRLRRVFTRGRFDSGGRLFGGFWQSLKKKEPWEGVDIQNEQAVGPDYGQLSPRILYGLDVLSLPSRLNSFVLTGCESSRIQHREKPRVFRTPHRVYIIQEAEGNERRVNGYPSLAGFGLHCLASLTFRMM
jgi:hypothetical protein